MKCPACEEEKANFIGRVGPGNSYSRYARVYICSDCGVEEAMNGFFWREWCPRELIKEHRK
jgi:hypothetical protein